MAKNDLPDLMGDRMGELLGGRKDTQKTDRQPTKTTRKTHKRTTNRPQKETLGKYHVRFYQSDWKLLEEHFRSKGLTVSAGLRLVVSEFLERERLR